MVKIKGHVFAGVAIKAAVRAFATVDKKAVTTHDLPHFARLIVGVFEEIGD
jgi:hypothetical protein